MRRPIERLLRSERAGTIGALPTGARIAPCDLVHEQFDTNLAQQLSDDRGNCSQSCCELRGIFAAGFGNLRLAAA